MLAPSLRIMGAIGKGVSRANCFNTFHSGSWSAREPAIDGAAIGIVLDEDRARVPVASKIAIDLQKYLNRQFRGGPFQNSECTSAASVYRRRASDPMRRWVGTPAELRALICDRREALDISLSTLNSIAGTQEGYAEKLLAPNPVRNFGPESLRAILGALGLGIARVEIVEDPAAAALVSGRWVRRRRHRRPRAHAERCVVAPRAVEQPSFAFVHHEPEQVPDERQTHDNDHDAR